MSDAPDHQEDQVLAGEYALGLLTPEEAQAFEVRMRNEPHLRALYLQWSEDLAGLAEDVSEESPPPRVERAIEARLFPAPRNRSLLERFGLTGLAAAVLAALLFVQFDGIGWGPGAPSDPVYIADIVASDASLEVAATYDADGSLYIERLSGQARSGRALELWLIEGDTPPVSLGVLPEDARARLTVPEPLRARLEGGVLAISDEPPGGSPTGAPTGDVLAVGEITNT